MERGRRPGGCRMTLLARLRKAEGRVVRRPLIVRCMTGVTVRRKRPERAARVATRAIQTGMGARQGEPGVIVARREPGRDAVTLLTRVGKAVRHVTWRRLIIGGVARIAIRGDPPEHAARMAACAVQSRMSARKREEVVTHKGSVPAQRHVAALTTGRPSARRMVRGGGARQIAPMA